MNNIKKYKNSMGKTTGKTIGKMLKAGLKASFTIEAAVVVPICMVIIMSAVITIFYFHDSVVLRAAAASIIPAKYLAAEDNENIYVQEAKAYFLRRLIILKNDTAESLESDGGAVMKTSGELIVNLGIAETILESSLGNNETETSIKSLDVRKNMVKYKVLCDGAENVGLIEGENK